MGLRWRELLVRWREVAIFAGVLFAINVAGRWVAKSLKAENQQVLEDRKALAGFVLIGVLGLVFVAVTVYWGRVRPFGRVGLDLGVAAFAACVLSVLVGPLIVGESPFANGAGAFFAQVWTWGGIALGGAALGYIVLVSFTADYRSRQLKAFAERKKVVPKRV
jgi:hypothetical protein